MKNYKAKTKLHCHLSMVKSAQIVDVPYKLMSMHKIPQKRTRASWIQTKIDHRTFSECSNHASVEDKKHLDKILVQMLIDGYIFHIQTRTHVAIQQPEQNISQKELTYSMPTCPLQLKFNIACAPMPKNYFFVLRPYLTN